MEGQNISIDYRWAEGILESRPSTGLGPRRAAKCDVIVAIGPPCAHAAKDATSTIPIVFAIGTDPVADGLIDSLARPGGNLTGVSMLAVDLSAKRLDLLSELLPQAREIALLVEPQ